MGQCFSRSGRRSPSPPPPPCEILFTDIQFVKQLVQWTTPALAREGVADGWKGFVHALEGLYDKAGALEKIRNLDGYETH